MRRRRNRRISANVSLFPFLAVLICTFGVLIVLLVLVVKSADHTQQVRVARKNSAAKKSLEDLQGLLDHEQVRVQGLSAIRPKIVKRLQDQRHIRVHLQNEIHKLEQEAELLARSIQRVDNDFRQLEDEDALNKKIRRLQLQLAQEQESLQRARQETGGNRRQLYSIVPHMGPNATQRRPIFIECTKDKLTIQPHGIELHRRDFASPVTSNNVLEAALTAIREYFVQYDLVDDQGFPYPLLVVRPDGSESYVLARRAMSNWTDEFGYELVSAEKELDFGENDQQLEQIIVDSIAAEKKRQSRLALRALQTGRTFTKNAQQAGGLRASSQFGGFVNEQHRRVATTGLETDNSSGEAQTDVDSTLSNGGPEAPHRESNPVLSDTEDSTSIASQRGSGWALPSRAAGATGYLRPVKIYCTSEELYIESSQGDRARKRIPYGNSSQRAVIQLVDALWEKIDAWGIAGANGYWKPQLNIVVMPGAERRFSEIELLLQDSGLQIEGIRK